MFPSYTYVPSQLTLSAFTHCHTHLQGHNRKGTRHTHTKLTFSYRERSFPDLFVQWGPLEDVCSLEQVAPAGQVAWDPPDLTWPARSGTCMHVHVHVCMYMYIQVSQMSPGISCLVRRVLAVYCRSTTVSVRLILVAQRWADLWLVWGSFWSHKDGCAALLRTESGVVYTCTLYVYYVYMYRYSR